MHITWHGNSFIKLQNGDRTILLDPFVKQHGITAPRLQKADIVVFSSPSFSEDYAIKDAFTILTPGEYEVKSAFVWALSVPGGQMISMIDVDQVRYVHLGQISALDNGLLEKELEVIEGADVLFIPVGGAPTLDAKRAAEVVSKIEPRVIIPIMMHIPGTSLKLSPATAFTKEMGVTAEPQDKIKISKSDLPQEETKVFLLNAHG
ncbi:MAG: MBL fold metallo-hydrolase [Patescibacteria group bacterium]